MGKRAKQPKEQGSPSPTPPDEKGGAKMTGKPKRGERRRETKSGKLGRADQDDARAAEGAELLAPRPDDACSVFSFGIPNLASAPQNAPHAVKSPTIDDDRTLDAESDPDIKELAEKNYPYQLVVEIAARLLKDKFYEAAAAHAIDLIDACRSVLSERRRRIEIMARHIKRSRRFEAQARRDGKYYYIPYRKALAYITGTAWRGDQTLRRFKRFYEDRLVSMTGVESSVAERKTVEVVAEIKKTQLRSDSAELLKEEFVAWNQKDASDRGSKAASARKKKQPG